MSRLISILFTAIIAAWAIFSCIATGRVILDSAIPILIKFLIITFFIFIAALCASVAIIGWNRRP